MRIYNWISQITAQCFGVIISRMPEHKIVIPVALVDVIRETVQINLQHVSHFTVYRSNGHQKPENRLENGECQHSTPQWEDKTAIVQSRDARTTLHDWRNVWEAFTTNSNWQLNWTVVKSKPEENISVPPSKEFCVIPSFHPSVGRRYFVYYNFSIYKNSNPFAHDHCQHTLFHHFAFVYYALIICDDGPNCVEKKRGDDREPNFCLEDFSNNLFRGGEENSSLEAHESRILFLHSLSTLKAKIDEEILLFCYQS